jgi:hypothetical protein
MRKKNNPPDRWEEQWFLSLTTDHKVFYDYIQSKAVRGGLWRTDKYAFEKKTGIKINLDKFLKDINKIEQRISELSIDTWFLHYYISEQCGPVYRPTYDRMVAQLKIVFLSGVPIEWIKGLSNPEKMDKEVIENSYTKRLTQFVSTTPQNNNDNSAPIQHSPITKTKRLKGSVPNWPMPEVSYTYTNSMQDKEIEEWLETQDFTNIIIHKKIPNAFELQTSIESHIKDVQCEMEIQDSSAINRWYVNKKKNSKTATDKLNGENKENSPPPKRNYSRMQAMSDQATAKINAEKMNKPES